MELPKKVSVSRIISARYDTERPSNWDERFAGVDVVATSDGETVTLASSGQQSTPKVGWTLMLTAERPGVGYEWTLYGIPRS